MKFIAAFVVVGLIVGVVVLAMMAAIYPVGSACQLPLLVDVLCTPIPVRVS